jgi:UDPglucose 6-dehydrogenase
MNVYVFGLWHLGSVTAACVAEHFPTVGLDPDDGVVAALCDGRPPIAEPGLQELVRQGLASGRLQFSSDLGRVAAADLVWVTFDTPVNQDDEADVELVVGRVQELFPHLTSGAVVLISSQVPVGTTARLEQAFAAVAAGRLVEFGYSPENLRLGRSLDVFRKADRIVVGTRTAEARARISQLLEPLGRPIQWMRVESAEMTKHAVNAFLATSVVFINEIAAACEATGADAKEVERALKSESRIGPGAYLGPGAAFAGGTLARDVAFLLGIGSRLGFATPLLAGVKQSNDVHRLWARRRLGDLLGKVEGKTIAVLGLTYKANTDTLRRSDSIALCDWLVQHGAMVRAFDPAIPPSMGENSAELPDGLALSANLDEAIRDADAIVVATEWPVFRELTADRIAAGGRRPLVLDANRFLAGNLADDARVHYVAVGRPESGRTETVGASEQDRVTNK